ncbi:hypothetical protein [Streptomyces sp. NPDC001492]
MGGFTGGAPTTPGRAAAHWVRDNCTLMPHQPFRVYDCAPASATSHKRARAPSVRVSLENLS